ncbi:two-component system sensor histidine kinase NtrB [Halapricum hydrolyticum]|uniref:histidine kinase n=1 Tax=Halapricum hydrolyticum TaxID=2979991 RepID=A0AAE3IFG4_9EURY|nr:PAS domain-containing sensor histidine kinase [Halapricum hydrolyticum]MCU4718092.1 PAS domain-containing sensor histidine kinase [Halapricum hydrolyticum]MCU4727400.1 PAS domain-containing sensor histidine kinase [Halapricum hydrolyticum]
MAEDQDRDDPPSDRSARTSAAPDSSPEERYRKIFQYNNDAVMVVDLETESFLDVNPAACDLLGYSREELLSMHPEDIHPNDVERVRKEFISQVYQEGSGFTDDLTCLTKDGEEVPTEISGAALDAGEDGTDPTQMIAMLRDISDRVEHRRDLEEKIERLDRFASIVSHDLKNPLSIINGHVTLARENGDPEHFDAIEDAVDRMDEMLSELLQLTREGHLVGERTDIELEPLAREVWIDCELDPATLEIKSSRTLYADRDRLHELFANLFENAHTHGGETVTVRVGTLDRDDRNGFYVEDDGEGIPADEQDTVFEWGHTTTSDGTGFGLAIVAEIAEAHGWEITVYDAEAGGTRFEIEVS